MIENENQIALIKEQIGFLFDKDLLEEIYKVGRLKKIESGDIIMDPGEEISYIPFIIQGSLKVSREKDDGEELLLYYIESGDTCAMTLQCCVRKSKSSIKATAMEDSLLLMIPMQYMEDWMNRHASWRQYILESYHVRISELMETIDAIAFMRLDERLDKYLKDQAKLLGSLEINHTHQQIAEDLHSSRVVISRLLKQMESKELIELKRNKVILKGF
ncbi:MAG TPA: Crp/Fnr family transcriptional regulator [Crocinitomicaceae bacterium]|nr:Crp/Fnr family transcriptional regulator [Crocinitomicaceae bacterium]